jgi:hypothetical protein
MAIISRGGAEARRTRRKRKKRRGRRGKREMGKTFFFLRVLSGSAALRDLLEKNPIFKGLN